MAKYVGSLAAYSSRTVVIGYLTLIILGGALLSTPLCRGNPSKPISPLDGIFTATSATCVTGLTVRSTGTDFNLFGQAVILVLIQIGGLGIMTITTIATLSFGISESIRARTVLTETLGMGGLNAAQIIRRIVAVTLGIETVGVLILALRFSWEMPWADAAYYAIFHTVSAFNNAGFGIRDSNLCDWVADPTVNLTIMGLIILGGIGFPTYEDIRRNFSKGNGWKPECYRLQTKVVVGAAGILLIFGTVTILALEWNNTLKDQPLGTKLLAAMMQSTTTRTAGFNTIAIGDMTEAAIFIMILLMFVGASPCSTGGGVKTSTVAAIVLSAFARIRGHREATVFKRNLPAELVERAIAMVLLYLFTATLGITLLLVFEANNSQAPPSEHLFRDCTFEIFSALGTVGLSTGITPTLTVPSKIVLIVLMYIGRIGPITAAAVISREMRDRRLEYVKENLLIG